MELQATDARSVEQLIELVKRGARPEYIFFWGHTPKVPGRIDHSCLSNWFPAPFEVDGVRYPTTEHYMMAEKARLFGDDEIRQKVATAGGPGKAKALGRQVHGFREEVWVEHRFGIVVAANHAKFSQNEEMGSYLGTTDTKVLVEASPRDRIWGIGMGKDNERATDPMGWRGLNLLGFALMGVRARLSESPGRTSAST